MAAATKTLYAHFEVNQINCARPQIDLIHKLIKFGEDLNSFKSYSCLCKTGHAYFNVPSHAVAISSWKFNAPPQIVLTVRPLGRVWLWFGPDRV